MTDLKYKEKLVNDILNKYKEYIELSKNPKTYILRKYLNLMHIAKYTNNYGNCIKCLTLGKIRQVNIRCAEELCHRYLCAEHFDEWHIENMYSLKEFHKIFI